jgi:hypothetical protein
VPKDKSLIPSISYSSAEENNDEGDELNSEDDEEHNYNKE